jgi:hypothetical protein
MGPGVIDPTRLSESDCTRSYEVVGTVLGLVPLTPPGSDRPQGINSNPCKGVFPIGGG